MQEVMESCLGFFTAGQNLKVFIEFIFLNSSLGFRYSSAQYGKKNDSKDLVFAGKVFILFWVDDRLKYVLKLSHGIW